MRAYRRDGRSFSPGAKPDEVTADGKTWKVTEDALVGPSGEKLARVPGHLFECRRAIQVLASCHKPHLELPEINLLCHGEAPK